MDKHHLHSIFILFICFLILTSSWITKIILWTVGLPSFFLSLFLLPPSLILGDPGADSGGEGKSKRAQNKARRKLKNGEKSPWGQCLTGPVPNGRHRSGFWLAPENLCFSGTNQKPERWRPFGTGLIRHCPQGLFSPFFAFLRALFFHSIRLSLAPTICSWVSEDVLPSVHPSYLPVFLSSLR